MASIFLHKAFRFFSLAIAFLLPIQTAYIFLFAPASSQYTRISFTVLDAFIALAFSAFVMLRMSGAKAMERSSLPRTPLLFLCSFLVFASISILFSARVDIALFAFARLIEGVFIFFIFSSGFISPKSIARAFLIAGVLQALLAGQQFFSQEIQAQKWLGIAAHSASTLGDSVVEGEGFRMLRAYGSFPHPNALAAFLGVSFLAGLYLYFSSASVFARSASLAGSMIVFAGLLFSFSRGVMLALIASAAFAAIVYLIKSVKGEQNGVKKIDTLFVLFGCVACIAVFTFMYWQPISVRFGFGVPARLEQRSIHERTSYIGEALGIAAQNPLGIGIGQYIPFLMKRDNAAGIVRPAYEYQPVHFHILLVLVETGVIGFALFFVFLSSIIFSLLKSKNTFAFFISAFLIFAGFFDHYFWTMQSGALLWWSALALGVRLHGPTCLQRV